MISVVIPVFNRAEGIAKTVANVFEQSFHEIEVIVVDDGSKDDIVPALEPFADRHNFQLILSGGHYGACHARNTGIRAASGEWIAFQDSDDLWTPKKLEKQYSHLQATGADICLCGMQNVYPDGRTIPFHPAGFSQADVSLGHELSESFFSTQLLLGKKACFEQEPFDERFPRFQDWDLGIRLIKRFSVVFLDEILAIRQVQSDSLSHNRRNGYIAGKLLLEKYRDDFACHPKALANFLQFYAQFQEAVGESSRANLVKSLRLQFRPKTLAKLFLQIIGVYGKMRRINGVEA